MLIKLKKLGRVGRGKTHFLTYSLHLHKVNKAHGLYDQIQTLVFFYSVTRMR